MTYTIITATSINDLRAKVNEMLNLQWIPQGGISIEKLNESSTLTFYYQALIRHND